MLTGKHYDTVSIEGEAYTIVQGSRLKVRTPEPTLNFERSIRTGHCLHSGGLALDRRCA